MLFTRDIVVIKQGILVIIRDIQWLSYKKCVVIMQRIDRHNNIVSSLLSEVFLAQFKLNHKQPSVLNNPHFPVTLRRITNTYDSHHIPRMITTVYSLMITTLYSLMITTICSPYDNHSMSLMITSTYSLMITTLYSFMITSLYSRMITIIFLV